MLHLSEAWATALPFGLSLPLLTELRLDDVAHHLQLPASASGFGAHLKTELPGPQACTSLQGLLVTGAIQKLHLAPLLHLHGLKVHLDKTEKAGVLWRYSLRAHIELRVAVLYYCACMGDGSCLRLAWWKGLLLFKGSPPGPVKTLYPASICRNTNSRSA